MHHNVTHVLARLGINPVGRLVTIVSMCCSCKSSYLWSEVCPVLDICLCCNGLQAVGVSVRDLSAPQPLALPAYKGEMYVLVAIAMGGIFMFSAGPLILLGGLIMVSAVTDVPVLGCADRCSADRPGV